MTISYTLSQENPQRQYIQFDAQFQHDGTEFFAVQLPAWRPGRYELGNFAKNIRGFRVSDEKGNDLPFEKTSKDTWKINGSGQSHINIHYEYYSAELNGGSTFLDENLIYVNPINCFMYRPGFEEVDNFIVELKMPKEYKLASPLCSPEKTTMVARNVHELLDSPFMASSSLDHLEFIVKNVKFHIWVNGKHELSLDKIASDFIPFCEAQIRDFKDFPQEEYLFLFHFLAQPSYHGVEHEKCTVITLGPAKKLLTPLFYEELLGVSSHELYHTWNVKALRPSDMYPYDYTKENYSKLGYVYEGVTTYMGDWYLLNSGVFDFNTYARHLGSYLNRHFQNQGRFNYSVAESSYDTWLDGYVSGAPGRKTSIYTEGCLVAFISDLMIINATEGKENLASAMSKLWTDLGSKGLSYKAEDYFNALEAVSNISFEEIKTKLLYGTEDFRLFLSENLDFLGLSLKESLNSNPITAHLGIKAIKTSKGNLKITDIHQNSPSDILGVHIGDEILAVNGIKDFTSELFKEIDFSVSVSIELNHMEGIQSALLQPTDRTFFDNSALTLVKNLSTRQQKLYNHWSGDK